MTDLTFPMVDSLEQQTRSALVSGNLEGLDKLFDQQHAVDVADVLDRLKSHEKSLIFRQISPTLAADVLHELGSETTRQLIAELPLDHVGKILDMMPMDEAVEVLTDDVPNRQKELLAAMSRPDIANVQDLLTFPAHSAGRLMTEKFVRVPPEFTVSQALKHLRTVDADVETFTDLYVLDKAGKLIGVLSLRELVTADPKKTLASIMTTSIVTIQPDADQEDAARLISRYDFLALPVTRSDNTMLGVITVDDLIDVLAEENTEDALKFGGVESGGLIDQPYFTIPLFTVIRKRVGWLLLLFIAETLTGSVLRAFEHQLDTVVALSFFIPLLIGTGGNTGAQTVSTIIRGLALKEIRFKDTWKVLMRELSSGLIMGILLGVVAFGRALLWGTDVSLALVVALTIVTICTWANTIGSLVPLVAQRFRIDPAVVSAPLITTLVDATGLAIYMLIAIAILKI